MLFVTRDYGQSWQSISNNLPPAVGNLGAAQGSPGTGYGLGVSVQLSVPDDGNLSLSRSDSGRRDSVSTGNIADRRDARSGSPPSGHRFPSRPQAALDTGDGRPSPWP